MMEFRHRINIFMRHTRDLTDEKWNILDPLRRAAGGDVGTTAGESSTAILASHRSNDFHRRRNRRHLPMADEEDRSVHRSEGVVHQAGQIMMFR
jgi:hypothetical protein